MTTAYETRAIDADTMAVGLLVNEASRTNADLRGHPALQFSGNDRDEGFGIKFDRDGLRSPVTLTLFRPGMSDPATLSVTTGPGLVSRIAETFGISQKSATAPGQSFKTKF